MTKKPETTRILKHFLILKVKEILLPILGVLLISGIAIAPGFLFYNVMEVDYSRCDTASYGDNYYDDFEDRGKCEGVQNLLHLLRSIFFIMLFWFGLLIVYGILTIIFEFLISNWQQATRLAAKEINPIKRKKKVKRK